MPLLLAPLGALAGRPRPAARFFLGFVLVVAAVHYGAPGVSAAASLPGLSLGTNLRLMPYLLFGIAALGALGVDALARGEFPIRWWPIRAWFMVLAVSGFAWVAMHHATPGAHGLPWPLWVQFSLALTGLTAAALVALRWGVVGGAVWGPALVALQLAAVVPPAFAYVPSVPEHWLYPETPAITWIQSQPGLARTTMPGHVGVLYGLFEPHGYDGLTPRRIAELVGSVGTGAALVRGYLQNPLAVVGSEAVSPAAVLTSPVVDLLGVRYVMLPPGAGPLWPHLTLGYDGRDARVFVNDRALPRAFLVFHARCVDDAAAPRLIREHAARSPARGAAGGVRDTAGCRAADTGVGRDRRLRSHARAHHDRGRRGGLPRADRHVVPRLACAGGRARRDPLARRPRVPRGLGARPASTRSSSGSSRAR